MKKRKIKFEGYSITFPLIDGLKTTRIEKSSFVNEGIKVFGENYYVKEPYDALIAIYINKPIESKSSVYELIKHELHRIHKQLTYQHSIYEDLENLHEPEFNETYWGLYDFQNDGLNNIHTIWSAKPIDENLYLLFKFSVFNLEREDAFTIATQLFESLEIDNS